MRNHLRVPLAKGLSSLGGRRRLRVCFTGKVSESKTKRIAMDKKRIITSIVLCTLIAAIAISVAAKNSKTETGPTAEGALAADAELAKALRENDADAIPRYLSDDWAVITTHGDVAEGKSVFPSGIKSGYRTLKTMDISEPRVRLYGDTALVTTRVKIAGVFGGKPFEIGERQTDVWVWKDGAWKCVLMHESGPLQK
jgi:ketosteroid isomerase-like protein